MSNRVPQTALPGKSHSSHDRLAKGLGYFSIALGMTELLASRSITGAAGIEGNERLVQAYGVREIATGVAILATHNAQPWIWGRVAGDALDIATLVAAPSHNQTSDQRKLWALAVLLGATALDVFCAIGLTSEKGSRKTATTDYSDRTGFPKGVEASRGSVQFETPRDMRGPEALRPWGTDRLGEKPGGKTGQHIAATVDTSVKS